ncbi:MAG TPA: DUF2147 domain-containing protein [Xanthobacteraceae bacterium]|nr:DUF2147 domain-containing protein [Xanthobacteraceae bacterium]
MPKLHHVLPLLMLVAVPALAAGPKPDPTGDWLVEDGKAIIHISACGPALCGAIAWTKDTGGVDENNPDPAKRNRPMLGLPLLLGMKPGSDGRWDGEVYNPENGKTYTSHMWLKSDDVLRLEGCVLGFLCGGQDWTRTKLETPAAGAQPHAKPAPAPKTK